MQSGAQFGVPDINQFMIDRGPPAQAAGLLALSSDIILPRQHQESPPIKPRLNMHPHYIPFPLNHHYYQQQQQTMQQRLMGRRDDSSDNQSSFAIQQQREEEDEEVEDEDEDKRGQEWSAEESLALVRIRSEMELKFHDSTLQAYFWEDVSRKFGELGYQRSAEECRENFEKLKKNCENGKRWREFTELEAVYGGGNSINSSGRCTNDGKTNTPCVDTAATGEQAFQTVALERKNKKKRKRRHLATIRSFFEKLVKQLMDNQEALHSKFLEAIERRDQERSLREEAWKRQEMARLTRENELRAQEQALASTREATIVAFLQKITGEKLKLPQTPPTSSSIQTLQQEELTFMDRDFSDVNGKRWPKPEVQALIRLRSNLEPKFQEPGPKGLLWQEISAGMTAFGFTNRSAKRCKEKWENINKYFRKTKGSIKKRPENAKTCPYFHQLDALYRKGILSSPNKSTRTDQIHTCSEALFDDSGQCNEKANGNHIQGHSENAISVAEEIVPLNNSDNIYFFRSPDPLVHCQNTIKAKNILSENICVTSKFITPNVEACVRGNPNGAAFSESSSKSEKMERLVKEMMEVQQQQQQHKLLQEFEKQEQYRHAAQPSVSVRNDNISRQQTDLKLIQERSQSVTQSALMALVDKLTAEIAGDYSIPAHSAKE